MVEHAQADKLRDWLGDNAPIDNAYRRHQLKVLEREDALCAQCLKLDSNHLLCTGVRHYVDRDAGVVGYPPIVRRACSKVLMHNALDERVRLTRYSGIPDDFVRKARTKAFSRNVVRTSHGDLFIDNVLVPKFNWLLHSADAERLLWNESLALIGGLVPAVYVYVPFMYQDNVDWRDLVPMFGRFDVLALAAVDSGRRAAYQVDALLELVRFRTNRGLHTWITTTSDSARRKVDEPMFEWLQTGDPA